MKAAVLQEVGHAPRYADFEEPIPGDGEVLVHVTASALTNFSKLRALGKHYSFAAKPPLVIGIDGIGPLDGGRQVSICGVALAVEERSGGGSGIRTHDTVSRIHAFQACAFSHSAIPPAREGSGHIMAAPEHTTRHSG